MVTLRRHRCGRSNNCKRRYVVFLILLLCITLLQCLLKTYLDSATRSSYRKYSENYTYIYPIHTLFTDDYSRLIDLQNFYFPIMANVCTDSRPFLLIHVMSAAYKFRERVIIRKTWGQAKDGMAVIFMLGKVDDHRLEKELQAENDMFRDIVQGDFKDTYRNQIYKQVMAQKYVLYHCPQAKYILKVDDDVFVNIDALLNYLKDMSLNGVSDLLLCSVLNERAKVRRDKNSRYYISEKDYPGKTYPNYCAGPAYLYSPDVMFRLYNELQRSAISVYLEDIAITGITAEKLNITHTYGPHLILLESTLKSVLNGHVNKLEFLFGPHQMGSDLSVQLWNAVEKQRRKA